MSATLAVAILVLTMGLLVSGRVRIDVVGVIALALVGVFHLIPTGTLFSGFSSYAAIILAEMFVLSEGLRRSGATDVMASWFERLGKKGESRLLTALMALPPIPSSFVSDVGLMSIFLPTMVRIRQRVKVSLHRLLMPLAIAIALGGLLSMIGSAGNIIGNATLASNHYPPIPLFGITPLGVVLVLAGYLFMKWWGVKRLPATDTEDEFVTNYQEVKRYLSEVSVPPHSPLIGKPLHALTYFRQHHLTVLRILRQGQPPLMPGAYDRLEAEDRLIIQGSQQAMVGLTAEDGLETVATDRRPLRLRSADARIMEAMVPQSSVLVNHSLREVDFRVRFGVTVLAILRQGVTRVQELPDMTLTMGDVLLVMGSNDAIMRLQKSEDLTVLAALERPALASARHRFLAIGVLAAVLVLATFNILAVQVGAAAAIAVLVLGRVISLDQAYRAIDWRIITLVGGVTPLSLAMTRTGVTAALAHALMQWLGPLGPYAMLTVFFILAAALTQVVSNVAAALVLSPLAISVAASNHWSPDGLIIAMIVALSAAPITPLANKVFIMAMGPGQYKYQDFLKIGLPMTLVMGVLTVGVTPLLFPFRH
ncbi:MAG: SLC13 family permease [Firmicutes bacterium]|nr:SLC13 family permease [Bacillota bacterium]